MSNDPVYADLELDQAVTWNDPKDKARAEEAKRGAAQRARKEEDPKQNHRTIINANYVGKYERAGEAEVSAELHVDPQMMRDAGPWLPPLQSAHNQSLPAVRSTLRAMGRLRDLQVAGAKLDPAELTADAKLAAKFHLPESGAVDQRELFDQWSNNATEQQIDVEGLTAGRRLLRAAATGYQGAEFKLQARAKQIALQGKKDDKAVIDEKIATLHKIADTVESALTWSTKIESAILSTRGPADLESVENAENLPHTQSRTQKATERAVGAAEFAHNHTEDAKKLVGAAGFTIDNLLMLATGDFKTYRALEAAIAKLTQEIAELGYDAETKEIEAATQQLDGAKSEVGIRVKQVKKSHEAARASARNFGEKVAGTDGALTMYAAQAYQELAQMGGQVQATRRASVNPRLNQLYHFLDDRDHLLRAEALHYEGDMRTAAHFYQEQVEQREFFDTHVHEWQAKARSWNEFFTQMTGGALVRK